MNKHPFLRTSILLSSLALGSVGCDSSDGSTRGGDRSGIAVIHSARYESTLVSLLSSDGELVQDDCINSGSQDVKLSLALSGDVVLPSSPQREGELVLIDRANDALLWMDPTNCRVKSQLSVGPGGTQMNPRDIVTVSADKAYVTRFNTLVAADGASTGGDVLVINPSAGALGTRIDLSAQAVSEGDAAILPRPDALLLVDTQLFVSLGNQTSAFDTTATGRVAIIDTTTDAVTGTLDIPEYRYCTGLSYVQDEQTLVVTCSGQYVDGVLDPTSSAMVLFDLSASPPVRKQTLAASDFGGRGVSSATPVSASRGFVTIPGEFGTTPTDAVWSYDAGAGTTSRVYEAADSFVLGNLFVLPGGKSGLLADATAEDPRIRVLNLEGSLAESRSFSSNPSANLPPRLLAAY